MKLNEKYQAFINRINSEIDQLPDDNLLVNTAVLAILLRQITELQQKVDSLLEYNKSVDLKLIRPDEKYYKVQE